MRIVYYYIIGAIALVSIAIGGTWIGAANGEVEKNNNVVEATGSVHARLINRYEKIDAFVDAIESANEAVLSFLGVIRDARLAYAAAIAANNNDLAREEADIIDTTFVNLVALLEDNPATYQTVNLYADFMGEFSASTNAVTYAIESFNQKVNLYNTHIQTFPNLIFLSKKTPYKIWSLDNYNATLPTFN